MTSLNCRAQSVVVEITNLCTKESVGADDGDEEGPLDGVEDGAEEGADDGDEEGAVDGVEDGEEEGEVDGDEEGEAVGSGVTGIPGPFN